MGNILGDKFTSILALIGIIMATWAGMERGGGIDLLPPAGDDLLMQIVLVGQSLGLFVSRTGSGALPPKGEEPYLSEPIRTRATGPAVKP